MCIYNFFYNDTPPSQIYTLSLHDALPISFPPLEPGSLGRGAPVPQERRDRSAPRVRTAARGDDRAPRDRKSTRLNSSHVEISYAVFCLKKKKSMMRIYIFL